MANLGINQTVVRDNNIKLILKQLQKKELSCSELASKLQLSKAALTKITKQMMQLNLIKESTNIDNDQSIGRRKTFLSINDTNGVVAAIDFSSVNIKIAIYNLSGNCLIFNELIDYEFLTIDSLELVVSTIKNIFTAQPFKDMELLCLCIGAAGKINKKEGIVVDSPKFRLCRDINLVSFFESKLNCKVIIQNDINLFLLAEQFYESSLIKSGNAILLFIDTGIGGSVLINNHVLLGDRGFAGEFGLVTTYDDNAQEKPYDIIISINAIKEKIKRYQTQSGDYIFDGKFRFKDVVKKYFENNNVVCSIVNNSAQILARLINNLIDVFDICNIIISGRICKFDSSYLQIVRSNVAKKHSNININYSDLEDKGVILGAISLAIDKAFDILIERRK